MLLQVIGYFSKTLHRNEEEEGYALLPQPVFIDCIAVAAYNAKEVRKVLIILLVGERFVRRQ